MDSLYNTFDLICPFCLNAIAYYNPGEKICPRCQADFEIDDRGECVFVNPDKLRLPINGTVYRMCGLVQGKGEMVVVQPSRVRVELQFRFLIN